MADDDLGRDRSDGQWLNMVPEELVQERQERARCLADDPHVKGERGDGRVVTVKAACLMGEFSTSS